MNRLIMTALVGMSFSLNATEYLIKFKKGTDARTATALKRSELFKIESTFKSGETNFAVVKGNSAKANQMLATQSFQDSNIEYIEENISFQTQDLLDEEFERQWGLKNTGRNAAWWWIFWQGTPGIDIKAEQAWTITKGSKDVKIGVIDTGVDYKHEDLKTNIMINEAELKGTKGVDDDGNGYIDDVYGYDFANNDSDPMDDNGHGTHCAGVIGAAHNSIGTMGVMADVQILPLKFLGANGSGKVDGAIKAIDYAIQRGVNVLSNSWGGGKKSQLLIEAVQRAEAAGILFVAAAGNARNDNDKKEVYPASIAVENVLTVGATNGKGQKAGFSNYGKKSVHIFAPGVRILSTFNKNSYKKSSGTSMAAPFVSGIAGLILANEPGLSSKDLKDRIIRSGVEYQNLRAHSVGGFVDAFEALRN